MLADYGNGGTHLLIPTDLTRRPPQRPPSVRSITSHGYTVSCIIPKTRGWSLIWS